MLLHDAIFIGLLSVLFLFKRSRYASFVYLVAYSLYLTIFDYVPSNYYHATSATINFFIFKALFKGDKFKTLSSLLSWRNYRVNHIVGLLSLCLIFVNLVGYIDYMNYSPATEYNENYRFIVAVQIFLLYIGNMLYAYVDRRDHKRALVWLNNPDSFKTFNPFCKKNTEQEK